MPAAAALKIPMGSTSDLPCTIFIHRDLLLDDFTGLTPSQGAKRPDRLEGQVVLPPDREERTGPRDPEQERSHAGVAVGDPALAGFDGHLVEQRPFLAMGI